MLLGSSLAQQTCEATDARIKTNAPYGGIHYNLPA